MSLLAGLTMLGAAKFVVGKTPEAKMRDVQFELRDTINHLRVQLEHAANGEKRCVAVERVARKGGELRTLGMSAAGDGAPTNPEFFGQLRELGQLMTLAERHCVRDRAVGKDALKALIPKTRLGSGGLGGATKVCIEYKIGGSGKVRCKKWSSGPGYSPGPQEEDTYLIQSVRDYYANALCKDPTNSKKCGLARKYRYRRSLPYLPRDAKQAHDIILPDVPGVKQGVVRIIALRPAPPLTRQPKVKRPPRGDKK